MFKRISLIYSLILIAVLCIPALRMIYAGGEDGKLSGYTKSLSGPPAISISNIVNKSLQTWTDGYVDTNFGFRTILVRSFNEVNFRIFRQIPHLKLYEIAPNGLYSSMSIDALNREIQLRSHVESEYAREAKSLLAVQQHLQSQGKAFMVVIAASKPYVYPPTSGNRYIRGGTNQVYSRAANFGDSLRSIGVNVIDMRPILREFVEHTNISTHADTGVHWNYYAGCLTAHEIMRRLQTVGADVSELDCGLPIYQPAKWVDIDGLMLLNIMSNGGLDTSAPYPSIARQNSRSGRPSFVLVGDSFSDQIIHAIHESNASSQIIKSGYFRTREVSVDSGQFQVTHDRESEPAITRSTLLDDIAKSDVLVIEVVDYQSEIRSFGFTDFYLERPEVKKFLNQGHSSPDAPLSTEKAPLPPYNPPVKNFAECSKHYNILALVEKNSVSSPPAIPGEINFARNIDDLSDMVPRNQPDFVVISSQAGNRSKNATIKILNAGYVLLADNDEYWIAYNKERIKLDEVNRDKLNDWQPYNPGNNVKVGFSNNLPHIESSDHVDSGVFTSEMHFSEHMIIVAAFEGTVKGSGTPAANLSFMGIKPIFNLAPGSYTPNNNFVATVTENNLPSERRLAFGLGGWGKGSGEIRINKLNIYEIRKSCNGNNQ